MATRRPLVRYDDTGRIEELRTVDSLPGSGGASSVERGVAVLNFGLAGNDQATVTVANVNVTATTLVSVDLNPAGTVDNDADEHFVEPSIPRIAAIVPGVSFDISMLSSDQTKLFGTWSILWSFNRV